ELLVRLPRLRLARRADDEAEVREVGQAREGAEEGLDALPRLRGAEVENVCGVRRPCRRSDSGGMAAALHIIHIRTVWNHADLSRINPERRQKRCGRLRGRDHAIDLRATRQLQRADLVERRAADV